MKTFSKTAYPLLHKKPVGTCIDCSRNPKQGNQPKSQKQPDCCAYEIESSLYRCLKTGKIYLLDIGFDSQLSPNNCASLVTGCYVYIVLFYKPVFKRLYISKWASTTLSIANSRPASSRPAFPMDFLKSGFSIRS